MWSFDVFLVVQLSLKPPPLFSQRVLTQEIAVYLVSRGFVEVNTFVLPLIVTLCHLF